MTNNSELNRLIHEKSTYLLQHPYNPVNWFSWSSEASKKAKQEDKPIFLSLGVREESEFQDVANIEGYKIVNEESTFYLCKNNTCSAPMQGIDTLKALL